MLNDELALSSIEPSLLTKGIISFPATEAFYDCSTDEEKGSNVQCGNSQSLAIIASPPPPVMDPLLVNLSPILAVDDELLTSVGNLTPENILVMVTVTVPADLTKMTVNLQGPFVINVEERKAARSSLRENNNPAKYPVYDILKGGKAGELRWWHCSVRRTKAIVINNHIDNHRSGGQKAHQVKFGNHRTQGSAHLPQGSLSSREAN